MRIRKPFAGAFAGVIVLAALAGLGPQQVPLPSYNQSDKVLHFLTFFILTTCFYWILETNRRRNLQFTIVVCPFTLGIGSEVVQGILPNKRDFDWWDILANVLGSFAAIGLSTWYHKRMLERKRQARHYNLVADDDVDIELGERIGSGAGDANSGPSIEEELDNWDENEEDWDEADDGTTGAKGGVVESESATSVQNTNGNK